MIYSHLTTNNYLLLFYKIKCLFFPNLFEKINIDIEVYKKNTKEEIKKILFNSIIEIDEMFLKKTDYNVINEFIKELSNIKESLELDLLEIKNDPAANSKIEIILSYPGFIAIFIYRISHLLFSLNILIIPRYLSEYAHRLTGIDINPAAVIGKSFFIDHGTGIVIGETTIIGDNVKIYQGVTLGALSTKNGQELKGKKRHPTIKNNVTIYANATILGGDTIIGNNVTIKANSLITSSIKDWEII